MNGRDRSGETRLIVAAYQVDYESARYLLEHGANPDLENARGQTALAIARTVRDRTAEDARGPVDHFIALLSKYPGRK